MFSFSDKMTSATKYQYIPLKIVYDQVWWFVGGLWLDGRQPLAGDEGFDVQSPKDNTRLAVEKLK